MPVPVQRLLTRDVITPWLPVPTGTPFIYSVVASLSINLNQGDYVQLWSHLEGTNDLGYNCMFARYLKESPTGSIVHSEGTMICKPMGQNITPDIHHGMLEQSGDFMATETRSHTFILVAYAASTAASPGDLLQMSYVELRLARWMDETFNYPYFTLDQDEFG